VLVLSVYEESLYARRALRAGARGYVRKEEPPAVILAAVRKVLQGGVYLSEDIEAQLLSEIVRTDGRRQPGRRQDIRSLTDRELEVFEGIGRGMATRRIAEKLHLSRKTVETHRIRIRRKLGFQDSAELVRHAVRWVEAQKNG